VLERYGPANRGYRSVFGLSEGNFPIEIPARLGKILTIREFHAVSEHVLFLKFMGSRITFQRLERIFAHFIMKFSAFITARAVDVAPDVGFRRS
jgi:hypothetical protein